MLLKPSAYRTQCTYYAGPSRRPESSQGRYQLAQESHPPQGCIITRVDAHLLAGTNAGRAAGSWCPHGRWPTPTLFECCDPCSSSACLGFADAAAGRVGQVRVTGRWSAATFARAASHRVASWEGRSGPPIQPVFVWIHASHSRYSGRAVMDFAFAPWRP